MAENYGSTSAVLAAELEGKAQVAVKLLGTLTDAEWKKVTAAERWTVGVTAHHLAGALGAVAGIVTTIVEGQRAAGTFTTKMLDEMNAQHARECADCTKAETIALFEQGATTALRVVRGLDDAALARSGPVFSDAPSMTAEQLIQLGFLRHIDEHMGSIRATIGR